MHVHSFHSFCDGLYVDTTWKWRAHYLISRPREAGPLSAPHSTICSTSMMEAWFWPPFHSTIHRWRWSEPPKLQDPTICHSTCTISDSTDTFYHSQFHSWEDAILHSFWFLIPPPFHSDSHHSVDCVRCSVSCSDAFTDGMFILFLSISAFIFISPFCSIHSDTVTLEVEATIPVLPLPFLGHSFDSFIRFDSAIPVHWPFHRFDIWWFHSFLPIIHSTFHRFIHSMVFCWHGISGGIDTFWPTLFILAFLPIPSFQSVFHWSFIHSFFDSFPVLFILTIHSFIHSFHSTISFRYHF